MATTQGRPPLERAVTELSPDISNPERLLIGLAKTLNIDESDILLTDSFTDLGGDPTSAHELEHRLQNYGVKVTSDTILRCKTVAELQAHAKSAGSPPIQSSSDSSAGSISSPHTLNNRVYSPASSSRDINVESMYGPPSSRDDTSRDLNAESVYGPPPAHPQDVADALYGPPPGPPPPLDLRKPKKPSNDITEMEMPATAGPSETAPDMPSEKEQSSNNNIAIDLDDQQELQSFLSSASRGEYFCLLKASAGPFENQLVAFVSIHKQSAGEAKGISLPPEREYQTMEGRIKKFYTALREWGGNNLWPDVWIPLHAMVTKGNGKPATRALQWWLKNLDEDTKQRILSLQRLLSLQFLDNPSGTAEAGPSRTAQVPLMVQENGAMPAVSPAEAISPTPSLFPIPPAATPAPPPYQAQPDEPSVRNEPDAKPEPPAPTRNPSRDPDIVVFKPEPIMEVDENDDDPEEEIEIALQEAKAVSIPKMIAQRGRQDSATSAVSLTRPPFHKQDSNTIQDQLETTRTDKTFSMFIQDESGRLEVHEQMDVDPEDVEFFPLSAMQQLFFRTSMNLDPKPNSIAEPSYRFGQSVLLRVKSDLEASDIEGGVGALVERHSMLRSRFRLTREGWAQVILPGSQNSYRFGHHQVFDSEDIDRVIEGSQASINPIYGPIFAAEHIRTSHEEHFIFLVAHHLAVDLISWRVIIRDLDELLRTGTLLSNPSIPFSNWIEYQGYESSHRLVQPKLPFQIPPPSLGYWEIDLKDNLYGNTEQFNFSLDAERTTTLRTASQNIFRTDPADVILSALLLSFVQTFPDREAPTIWTQEHGRETKKEDFNIDETVGWFTSLCPTSIMASGDTDPMELLKFVKDTRQAIPNKGITFFNTEFSTPSAPFTTIPVEIMFSCVDNMHKLHTEDGVLDPVARPNARCDSVASDIGPAVGRIALFEINVSVEETGATVEATYIRPGKQDRVEQWLKLFQTHVTSAIDQLKDIGPQLTLADAPLLKTTYNGLSKLAEKSMADLGLGDVGDVETIHPVSPSQEEILIAQSLDPEAFWVHAIYELSTIEGKQVNQGKLCAAWSRVVESHTALRSVFVESVDENGLFDQLVLRKFSPDMLFLDSDTPVETLAELPAMRTVPGRPKHRLSVCKSGEKTFIRVDVSQALCDAIAVDNLVTRMRMAYADDKSTPADDTMLLRNWLLNAMTADTSASLTSWQGALASAKPCIFPALTVKPEEHKVPGSKFFGLEIKVQELQDFSVQREIEAVHVLQLAWALVLRAYVGIDHVSFGYETSGRNETQMPGMKGEVGSFAALSPCTVDLGPGRNILECLKSLTEMATVGKQNHVPTMAEVQHAMNLNTDELFNTCLSMRDFDNARHKHRELDEQSFMAKMVTSSRLSNCDLSLSTMFIDDHLHIDFSYRNITATQAQNIMHTFERATRLILDSPSEAISSIDLFTDRDYAQLVVQDFEFSLTGEKANTCVHQLVLPHAQKRPEAAAICAWDGNMTYHQMSYCVSTLATYLRNIGITPGLPVPVVMEKTKWAPIIMLGVLKAGGSMVCLDAGDRNMIEATIKQLDSRIVVSTDTAWSDIVYAAHNVVIVNERFFSTLPPQISIPMQDPTPDDAACVMYIPSKSKSGPSRSLFFTHSSLSLLFLTQGPALKLDKDSRVLQLSAFNVDIALVEILGTLVHGGCVCIPSNKDRLHNTGDVMARYGITWSYMTLSLARRIDPNQVPRLKTICFRTRRLNEDTRKMWLPNRNILLAYGAPDVCPLGIAISELNESSSMTLIPQPLMGRFWILNPEDQKKLMPLGAVGELAIDCPLLTPHKFIPGQRAQATSPHVPATDRPTRLRYLKTGHRVRYLDNGNIQFLSSMRDDVLIDGSRVSVSDIEHHLRCCLGVKFDIIVESVTTSDSVQLLAAFLEIGDDGQQDPEDLENLRMRTKERTLLAKALRRASSSNGISKGLTADHIPSVFIPLKSFPLSHSLKVNRRKLQKMISAMTYKDILGVSATTNTNEGDSEEKPLPLTHAEERMRHVWAGVLDILPGQIKSSDSFIGLGGDRYLATKLVVAARQSSMELSLGDVLKGATLTKICQAMDASDIMPVGQRPQEARTVSNETSKIPGFEESFVKDIIAPLAKVHYREILDVAEASSYQIHGLETRMYGLKGGIKRVVFNFNGPIRSQKLQHACETLSQLHPIFRTAFAVHERHVYQVLLDNFRPEFHRFACPAWCLGSVADNVIAEDQEVEFKPEIPVTKFTFLDAGQQSTLIVRLSSAQIDKSAVTLLVQELAALYQGQANVSHRPSFFDYMRSAQSTNTQGAVEYWKNVLDGSQMTQFVSQPKPYPPAADIKTLNQTICIDSLAEYGLNFATVLKAAWSIVLAQYSASHDVVFGEVIQAQNIPLPERFDVSSLIAPTSNVVPVRVTFTDTQEAPLDFMQALQEKAAASKPHEALGLLEIVQRCTDWPYWTRFSTVVQHQLQPPLDGATTLNMGDTTFTHAVMEPGVQDIPDLYIVTTMDGPQTVNFQLQYSPSRVPDKFAEDALRVLTIAVDMITSSDTIEKPMLQSATEISRSAPKIPLPEPEGLGDAESLKPNHNLPHDDRHALQSVISGAWTRILDPRSLGVPDEHMHKANFYDLWGSILPAQAFADCLNEEFLKQPVQGLHKVRLTPAEIITNPTMATQYALVVRKMAEQGVISTGPRIRKPVLSLSSSSKQPQEPPRDTPSPAPSESKWPLEEEQPQPLRKKVGTLRGLHQPGFVRSKAGEWVRRHRSNRSKEKNEPPKALTIGEPVATELPPRAALLRDELVDNGGRTTPIQNEGSTTPSPLRPDPKATQQPLEPVDEAAELAAVNSMISPRTSLSNQTPDIPEHSPSPSSDRRDKPANGIGPDGNYIRGLTSPEQNAGFQNPAGPGEDGRPKPSIGSGPPRRASGDSSDGNGPVEPLGPAWLAI